MSTDEDETPQEREPERRVGHDAMKRLLQAADRLGEMQHYCLSLVRDLHAGAVPNWELERDARSADLTRRWAALEPLVTSRLP